METYSMKSSQLIVYRLRLDYNECCNREWKGKSCIGKFGKHEIVCFRIKKKLKIIWKVLENAEKV